MRILWRRPLRTSRRGIHTLSSPSYISRHRPNAATSPVQWRRMTTLFYSTIIATAAAVDVELKQRRNEQWDKAIAKAEHDLDALEPGSSAKHKTAWEERKLSVNSQEVADQLLGSSDTPALSKEDQTRELLRRVQTESPPGLQSARPPNAQTWTPKKLLTVEYSMAKLAARMLKQAYTIYDPNHSYLSTLQEKLSVLNQTLEELKSHTAFEVDEIPSLQFPHYSVNPEDWPNKQDSHDLNYELVDCFRDHNERRAPFPQLLTRLAYVLLNSVAPPDERTYTILISRFSKLSKYASADMVITSITEAHVRPDQVLVGAVLQYYQQRNSLALFEIYVMKLKNDKLVMLGFEPPSNNYRLSKDSKGRIWQGIEMNAVLFRTIVGGYLRFNRLHRAKQTCEWMESEGFAVDTVVLNLFLRHCARFKKWSEGMSTWQSLKTLWAQTSQDYKAKQTSFVWAMELCRKCGKVDALNAITQEALDHGWNDEDLKVPTPDYKRWIEDETREEKKAIRAMEEARHQTWLQSRPEYQSPYRSQSLSPSLPPPWPLEVKTLRPAHIVRETETTSMDDWWEEDDVELESPQTIHQPYQPHRSQVEQTYIEEPEMELAQIINPRVDVTHIEQTHTEQNHIEQTHIEQTHIEQTHIEQTHIEQPEAEEVQAEQTHIKLLEVEETQAEQTHIRKPEMELTQVEQFQAGKLLADQNTIKQTTAAQHQTPVEPKDRLAQNTKAKKFTWAAHSFSLPAQEHFTSMAA